MELSPLLLMFWILVRFADYLIIQFLIYTAQKDEVEVPIKSTPPHNEVIMNNLNMSPSLFSDQDSEDSLTTFVENISYHNKSSAQAEMGTFLILLNLITIFITKLGSCINVQNL